MEFMRKTHVRLLVVIAILVISAGVTGGVAASEEWELSGTSASESAVAGETVELTFTTTHDGNESTNGVLKLTDLPENWTINSTSGDGTYKENTQEILYLTIPKSGTVTSTVTVSIPESASPGEYNVTGEFANSDNVVVATTNATVSVDQQLQLDAGAKRFAQGKNGSVGITVSNDGTSSVGAALEIDRSTIPASWNVSVEGEGELKVTADSYKIVYLSIPANGELTSKLQIAVPSDANVGTSNISVSLETSNTTVSTGEVRVTVTESVTEAYDGNGDGSIETDEVLTAISDWIGDGLTLGEVFDIIEVWASS